MVSGGLKAPGSRGRYLKFSFGKILVLTINHSAFLFKGDMVENPAVCTRNENVKAEEDHGKRRAHPGYPEEAGAE